ncbi:MAG: tyrosine-type recombinase/integrase [Gammaproteobacteria bacterium]|nr:tyrosine-type recombinase/integrase [Gammaproteobacteria bacterium]
MSVVRRTGDMDRLLAGFGVAIVDIQALRAARGAWSENTKRALRSDLEIFGNWCVRNGLQVLPARAETVARFVESVARERAPATLKRYVSNISALHKASGYAKPSDAAAVRLVLQYMQRHKDCRQRQALGLTWEMRDRMIAATGGRLPDLRNRALLAVMYDAMLRGAELVALEVSDLSEPKDGGATLLVRRSKTDQTGEGTEVYLTPNTLKLLREWLEQARIRGGRIFRSIRPNGLLGRSLDVRQVSRIFKKMARQAGFDKEVVDSLSAHSARIGATQDMIASDFGLAAVMQAGRWKTASMVLRYGERLLVQRGGAARFARLKAKQHASG